MSAKNKAVESPQFGMSTKLLAGAIIGMAVGLIGLLTGLSSGNNAPFLGWLWGSSLAQHRYRHAYADYDI